MKDSVDAQLRDQQAGFRKGRSCTDQIATLRIIVEQSIEWNSSLYINFIDYEKAFDSVDRTSLRRLLRYYGVPQKIINIIHHSYDGLNCKIVHGGQLTDSFDVKTVIDWIMKTSTSEGKHGIQWTSKMQLDDLDFADDLALLSQAQQQMQKTISVAAASAAVGLHIHKGKSRILRYNTACTNPITIDGEDLEDEILRYNTECTKPITIDGEDLEDVKTFTYLGRIIDEHSGTDADREVSTSESVRWSRHFGDRSHLDNKSFRRLLNGQQLKISRARPKVLGSSPAFGIVPLTYTSEKPRSSNTTWRAPTQPHLVEELCYSWKHPRIWVASSMNKENLKQIHVDTHFDRTSNHQSTTWLSFVQPLTITWLVLRTQDPWSRLQFLASLRDVCSGLKGKALASRVFANANHEDDIVTLIIRRFMFSIVSSLLWFTNQWICDSHLDDPYHELFVDIGTSMKMGRLCLLGSMSKTAICDSNEEHKQSEIPQRLDVCLLDMSAGQVTRWDIPSLDYNIEVH
ncbi:unnamed protein product [Schistosoma curassoni]|uniref:Reverse transcriptase domain-containing protein n=1 Tax=Schistosoma curassoni TaxID=6186 RepID=A0A183K8R7_9TREM|nr:unnamed protein product [Schistosoma curassoni]